MVFFDMGLIQRVTRRYRMIGIGVIAITALFNPPVFAKSGDSSTHAAESSETATVLVSRQVCEQLIAYVPDDDVTYKPGVDVNGNPVVPADGGAGASSGISLPDVIEFPVTIDFFENAGIANPVGISGKGQVGKITFRDGHVYFNDKPITNAAGQEALAKACRAAGFR